MRALLHHLKDALCVMCHKVPDVFWSCPISVTTEALLVAHLSQLKKMCSVLYSILGQYRIGSIHDRSEAASDRNRPTMLSLDLRPHVFHQHRGPAPSRFIVPSSCHVSTLWSLSWCFAISLPTSAFLRCKAFGFLARRPIGITLAIAITSDSATVR